MLIDKEVESLKVGDIYPVSGPSGDIAFLWGKTVRLHHICVGHNESGEALVTCKWREESTGRLLSTSELAVEGGYSISSNGVTMSP